MKKTPFETASTINDKTGRIDIEECGYEPYVINKIFSNTKNSVLFANEMNSYGTVPKQWQFDFYYYGLDKTKRFGKWYKNQDDKEVLELLQSYLNCSLTKAKDVKDILMPHIDKIRAEMDKGGKNGFSG